MATSVAGLVLENRYEVRSLIARGGMAAVYAGTDRRLDRPVAIKIMDSQLAEDKRFVERFVLEARAAARLHHPHVVAVYDQGIDQGYPYLVMELVTGGTLRDLLDSHRALAPAVACAATEAVLDALAAAHRAGLVHRDVKPENVLIGPDGAVKVGDFGLVRATSGRGMTSTQVILGTVAYLSPEQVATGVAGPHSDVYSAGVLLYEMLTGEVPYSGDTALSVAYRHVNDDVPAPSTRKPGIPGPLDELVVRATRRDPAARPATGEAFLAELREARTVAEIPAAAVPVPDTQRTEVLAAVREPAAPSGPRGTRALTRHGGQGPAPVPAPVPRPQRRARRLVALAVVLLVLGGAGGVAAWWFGSGRWTSVPKVAGLDLARAQRALENAELHYTVRRTPNDTVPAGAVVSADPAAGDSALRGSTVTLTVSLGKPTVPDIRPGTPPADAARAIRRAGLVPRRGNPEYSDSVTAGGVARVHPQPGTQLDVGAVVTIVVSKGQAPKPVPDVVGMPHDEAFAALQAAGLQPYDGPAQYSPSAGAGTVISTSPKAGTPLAAGHKVQVVVSNSVTVPLVIGQPVAAAEAQLQQLGLAVVVRQLSSNPDSRVLVQSAAPGSRVKPGSSINLTAF